MELLKLFTRKKEESKNVAKDRLKLVLIHDRADFSPKFLEMIKGDVIRVISQYADIDEEGLDIKLTKMKRDTDKSPISALVANIPITRMKNIK